MKKVRLLILVLVAVLAVGFGINAFVNYQKEQKNQTNPAKAFKTPEPRCLIYQPEGNIKEILVSEKEEYLHNGWYDQPMMYVYNIEGETTPILKTQLTAYIDQGWYERPVMTVYNVADETQIIEQWEYDAYHKNGFYDAPVMTVYTTGDKSMVIYRSRLESYLEQGWYKTKEEVPLPQPPAVPVSAEPISPGTKLVALTFDDGPGPYTDAILDCLVENNAKATFFVVGTGAKRYPTVLKRAYNLGMEIGNHTMSHGNLSKLDAAGILSQLNDAQSYVVAATGAPPTLIRPPYGSYNATVKSTVTLPLILWSIDTLDWKTRNADSTVNTILNEVKDGSIVLMHDIHAPTLEAVKRVVPELTARGYKLVTVSELARAKGVTLEPGKAYGSIK